jgi:hypothetical protein
MWQKFPGWAKLYPGQRGSFRDLWMAFHLNGRSREFFVVIWRDVVFRSGPYGFADTTYTPIDVVRREGFLAQIEKLVLPVWKRREYTPTVGVLDGWSWNMTLRRGQRLRHWEGRNAYPPTFREVCALIAELIERPQLIRDANYAYRPT